MTIMETVLIVLIFSLIVGVVCTYNGFVKGYNASQLETEVELKRYILVDKYQLKDNIVDEWEAGKLVMKMYFTYKEPETKPKLRVVKSETNLGGNDND